MIKIAIIGAGIMGRNAVAVWSRDPRVEVTAICDIDEKRAQDLADELGVKTVVTDYRQLLDGHDISVFHINTPDQYHKATAVDALKAGMDVLVEKPMTTDVEEADEMVKTVKETGRKLQVSFNHRWLSVYHKTFEEIRDGNIGTPLMGYAKKNNPILVPTEWLPWSDGSSPAWFLSSHDIDLMTWWVGKPGVEVFATGAKKVLKAMGKDTYDAIHAQVRYEGGFFATFESCWIYSNKSPYLPDSYMQVVGEKGHIFMDRKAEAMEMATPDTYSYPRTLLNYKIFDRWQGAYPSSMYSFIDAIIEDREPFVTVQQGRNVTAILDAIHRSLASGKAEKVF
jgi:predicted dehydrogenase